MTSKTEYINMAKRKSKSKGIVLAEKIVDRLNELIVAIDRYEKTFVEEKVNEKFGQYVNGMVSVLSIFRDLLKENPPQKAG